ncbi:vetispiradiene synthase 2-like [Olea europaea subsp. europaea]|uniref:Vetispiradiene synthase 2-like n=1 Tax=Olea europaea subsp. europaea TaxID=158383 RepID=A0A8S0V7P4_OLEEU|nr:vetispiradiene synthase 2-like [Olea europaea subsp. europaea]
MQLAEKYAKEIEGLKNQVRGMLTTPGKDMVEKMNLIDTLERLGVSYHFEDEIEELLERFFNLNLNYADEAYDLYTVALHFRVLRQHGYRISCAAYLRVHGEDILEDALVLTMANLKSMAPHLSYGLGKQVTHALVQSIHFGIHRIEARNFISIYEEDELKNELLLRLAKLDYNALQLLHKQELFEISRWWKELDLISKLSYARDRVVECFFWTIGVYHEPQFQWEISEIDRLPEYIKPSYSALLNLYDQFDEELSRQRRSYVVYYAKEALKELARAYYVEAKWFIEGYLPPFSDYMSNALITCTYYYLTITSLQWMKFVTKEQFEWLSNKPKVLVASLIICRLIDDIATYEVEKERGQIATGIESYMKENGVTKEEAMDKFFELANNAWKDINEECLITTSCSKEILMRILKFGCIVDVTYKDNEDGYTHPEKVVKPYIIALFIDPIQV